MTTLAPSPAADHDGLSVLCADVAGGERWAGHPDTPEALYAMGRCEKRIRREMERHGGQMVARRGRKLMAYFSDGVDALQSAIDIQRRIAELPPASGVALAARVGICSGHRSKEERYFPGDGTNPAASLCAAAYPGRILLSMPRRVRRFPWEQLVAESVPDLLLNCGNRQLGVFQVPWQVPDTGRLRSALVSIRSDYDGLRVVYGDREIVIAGELPAFRIGRQRDSHLVVRDTRCSRVHVAIERRPEGFVLVDRSRNGTFVKLAEQTEVMVHGREMLLSGRGRMSLGVPAATAGAELLDFEAA